MPELRVILLIAGIVLIAGLWIRERRRSAAAVRSAAASRSAAAGDSGATEPPVHREAGVRPAPPRVAREAPADLPVIQIDAADDIDMSFASAPSAPPPTSAPATAPASRADSPTPQDSELDEAVGPVAVRAADPAPWDEAQNVVRSGADLVIDWPPEAERQIVALRVVPRGAERFAGRSVRQALIGEGFLHGSMDIFHLPGDDARVLISAASLTRPGVFHLESMDTERFAGLNIFAVLPGALPPDETFDRLIEAARGTAARLNAELRDQRGEPLTTARVVELRAALTGAER